MPLASWNILEERQEPTPSGNTIKGKFSKIIFEKDGFIIAIIETKDKREFKVKGNLLSPQFQIEYAFTGKWESHSKYGYTLAFTEYKASYPKELNSIRHYLMENCKWVGPEISTNLVNSYKEKTLEICKNQPEKIAKEITGITLRRAKEISVMLKDNEANEELMIKLKDMLRDTQISKRAAAEIVVKYRTDAIALIQKNPYALVDDIDGVGFLTADKIAMNVGFSYKSNKRIRAGVIHILKGAAEDGSTYLPDYALVSRTKDLLSSNANDNSGIDDDMIEDVIENMLKEKKETK